MKKVLIFFLFSLSCPFVKAQTNLSFEKEQKAIKQLLEQTYIKTVYQKKAEPELLRTVCHPTFRMYVYHNGETSFRPLDEWLSKLEANKDAGKDRTISWEFLEVDVTGNAAMVKLEIYGDEKTKITTDYLCLYKLENGWKVFTKTFAH